MLVQEVASKHGMSVQKVLTLLDEVGVEGKEISSALNDSELKKLEEKITSGGRPMGRGGAVKVLRPSAGTPIVRRRPTSRTSPQRSSSSESGGEDAPKRSGSRREERQSGARTPKESESRRSQAGSKARNLLRAKRMRESGITRRALDGPEGAEVMEESSTPTQELAIAETAEIEIPVTETATEESVAAPAAEEPAPAASAETVQETVEQTPAGEAAPAPAVPPTEAAGDAEKAKRGKGKKQKKEEIIESSKERATTQQERKVLASILGQKKGKKQRYKRTKKERFAAVEEAERERVAKERTTLRVHEATTVADVAHGLNVNPSEIQKILLDLGKIVTVNQRLDPEAIEIIAEEFGFEIERGSLMDVNLFHEFEETDHPEDLRSRPPVITVMGHVDHGKTKLLDAIRSTDVTSTEAGGITQHIGAYFVQHELGDACFLDTPGHEAFTAMRARGAMVTDIVVLVVAADDGIMPQTKEAIAHAKAADVPIIVAINKVDLPAANVDNVKQQLAAESLLPEDWGGKTPVAEISALKKIGIDQLVELIHLQAELLELKANPNKGAKGTIVEARLEQGQGVIATALIQEGTLSVGDPIVAGIHAGKVRALTNDHGKRVKSATPGMPVAILGLSGTPEAGDELHGVPDERTARELSQKLQQLSRERERGRVAHVTLESLFNRIEEGSVKDLNLIVKGDVDGSVGAVCEALQRIESEKVKVRILHRAVGSVSESDVMLASASDAIILGFNVAVPVDSASLASQEAVDIRTYNVIYDAIDDVKKAMLGLLEDEQKEVILGRLEILRIFRSSKAGLIIGGEVRSGRLLRGASVRVIRDGRILHTGKLSTLRRFKDEVQEVSEGLECGVGLERFQDVREGDIIECFQMETIAASL
jgi:translation initiation factor IF-2